MKWGREHAQRLDFESKVRYAKTDLRDGEEYQGGFQERNNGIQLFVTESIQAAVWDQSGTGDVAMGERKPIKNTMATAQARKELRSQQGRDISVYPQRARTFCF